MRVLTILLAVLLLMTSLLADPEVAAASSHSGVVDCNYCHRVNLKSLGPHRAATCLSCHGPGGSSTRRAASHIQMDCRDCHMTHGGSINWLGEQNGKFLRHDIDKTGQHSDPQDYFSRYLIPHIKAPDENYAQVVFTSRGTGVGEPSLHSFADGDQDRNGIYDGICEVCHLEFLYQNEQASGPHHIGETCTACHLHSNGFR